MDLIRSLAELTQLRTQTVELVNRVYGLQIGVVTDNVDPLNLRRIRVSPQSKAGISRSDWLGHCNPQPSMDAPIPVIGSTVYFLFIDGDPHDGVWLGVTHNDTNPSDPTQTDPVSDCATEIPGNDRRTITGDLVHQVVGDRVEQISKSYSIEVSQDYKATIDQGAITITTQQDQITITGQSQVRVQDGGGAFVVMSDGNMRIGNAAGQELVLGGGSGSEFSLNAAGGAIAINNASDVTINGKSVLVLGSKDSRNDTSVSKGY